MSNLVTKFFGPLDKGNCIYFLIICGIFFITLVLTLFSELYFVIRHSDKLNFRVVSNGILILFNIFLAYFVNRLLYTMCSRSLA